MSVPTHTRPTSPAARQTAMARRLAVAARAMTVLVGGLLVLLVVILATREAPAPTAGIDLPNPMGGPVQAAPYATGQAVDLGGLEVVAPDVTMGDVPLNTTVVPRWEVTNPTDAPLTFTVGQPRVVEGCCPGPIYVGDDEVPPGGTVTVAPDAAVTVLFPLQMHPGMDGPHHLTVPLQAEGVATELHVTGNFTATATASA